MNYKKSNWTVGATVLIVPEDTRRQSYRTTVEKVGTKWVTCSRGLRWGFDGRVEYNCAAAYLSEQHWLDEIEARRLWSDCFRRINIHRPPGGLSLRQVQNCVDMVNAAMGRTSS